MKLSELIETTLSEIAAGVGAAKQSCGDVIAVAPNTVDGKEVGEISYIEFDISVIVEEQKEHKSAKEKGGKGEIQVLSVVGIGGKATSNQAISKVLAEKLTHRITFKIPVCMNARYKNSDKS